MKIAIAQLNTIPADFEGNFDKIQRITLRAEREGAEIIVFPELSLSGYMNQDIMYAKEFRQMNLKYLKRVASISHNIGILIGHISAYKRTRGFNRYDISSLRFGGSTDYYNSATFFYNKRRVFIYHKHILPEFDIFNEARYFEPGRDTGIFKFKGKRIGVNICEDIWHRGGPYEEEATSGADIIINISASPFYVGKPEIRFNMIKEKVKKYKKVTIYVNAIGGQDGIVYDGNSMAFSSDGRLIAKGGSFTEDLVIVDTASSENIQSKYNREEMLLAAIVLGIRDYFRKNSIGRAVIGLSGGVDSALVATLCKIAIGEDNVVCVFMPTRFTSKLSRRLINDLITRQKMRLIILPIDKAYSLLAGQLRGFATDVSLPFENLQSRLRGTILMFLANSLRAAVVATSNKNEIALGYNTLYGDTVGALAPIGDIYKDEVIALCNFINNKYGEIIPPRIINRVPTAELRRGQRDEDDLPPYQVTNRLLPLMLEENRTDRELVGMGFDIQTIRLVHSAIRSSEFKRYQMPPVIKLKPKSFGCGRKIPITHRFEFVR